MLGDKLSLLIGCGFWRPHCLTLPCVPGHALRRCAGGARRTAGHSRTHRLRTVRGGRL